MANHTDDDGGGATGYVPEEQWWFCLKHHQVETREGCPNKDRLGPYSTRDQAARALERVAERNDEWEHDPAWNDDEAEQQ
ncbi:hypothetical protein [Nocardioides sp.]|uniref:hypothetical protein n=1 Tax=Nocardioides sp. TaxID=35761 RepID=UPI0039E6927C